VSDTGYPRVTAIDPIGCGCTECLTGEYVPLEEATDEQVRRMVNGVIRDHTGVEFIYRRGMLSYGALEWRITPERGAGSA
jgi:hypothetical protein